MFVARDLFGFIHSSERMQREHVLKETPIAVINYK